MYLEHQVEHKMQEMMREAEHERLVRLALAGQTSPHVLSAGVDLLGRQLIRLGTLLARRSQPAALQSQTVECVCTA